MSSKQKSTQQTTEKTDPWAPAMPYLTEMLGNASGIFKKYQEMTPEQKATLQQGQDAVRARQGSGIYGQMQGASSDLLAGKYAPNISAVAAPGAPSPIKTGQISGGQISTRDMVAPSVGFQALGATPQTSGVTARSAQGALDPTAALSKALSGQVDNPQLSAMAQAATRQGQRNFSDALQDSEDSFTRSIAPSIRSGAQLSGQYGGSRQGIAEGMALAEREKTMGRAARDLGIAGTDATAGLFGRAYESAQDRMAGTADNLDARALAIAEANAGRAMQGGMFDITNAQNVRAMNADYDFRTQGANIDNAFRTQGANLDNAFRTEAANIDSDFRTQAQNQQTGLAYDQLGADVGFQNNQQEMQRAAQAAGQLSQGAGLFGQMGEMQDADFAQIMEYLGYPAQWEMGLLAPTAGAITGIGGLGRQSSGTSTGTTKSSDPMGTISNLAMAAAMAYSDERLKRNVETVGYDARGRRQVSFSYVWDKPGVSRVGFIAQELQKSDPHAVATDADGYLMVDYSKLEG